LLGHRPWIMLLNDLGEVGWVCVFDMLEVLAPTRDER
jgi:hypothetical protein